MMRTGSRVLEFSVLALLLAFPLAVKTLAQPSSGAKSLRMEIEGIGTIIVKSPQTESDSQDSQVLLEKPGGTKKLLIESKSLIFVDLLKGDLDGDQFPEIVVIAKSRMGDDLLPFILKGQSDLKQVFPPREEDNPLIAKEITIVPGKTGVTLCVKTLFAFHDFGPPDLFINDFYRLQGDKLEKVGERVLAGPHFNQQLNVAAMAFQKGNFSEALKEYQVVIASFSDTLPPEARVETYFFMGESRKWQKDFEGAIVDYTHAAEGDPALARSREAQQEIAFLKNYLTASQALSLFIEASLLEKKSQFSEALSLLEKANSFTTPAQLGDYLLLLKGEILVSLGRVEEALKIFHFIKEKYPKSPVLEKVENSIRDLQSEPDEME